MLCQGIMVCSISAHEVRRADPLYIKGRVSVISCGLPGVGKSTLLRELSRRIANCIYLDKDKIAPALLIGQEDPSYFSEYYYKYVRNQTYEVMFAIAEDNCRERDTIVLLDGFLGDKLHTPMVQKFLHSLYSEKKIVYFHCSQEENEKRLRQRREERDQEKLINFPEYYCKTLAVHEEALKQLTYLSIDTERDPETNILCLLEYLQR